MNKLIDLSHTITDGLITYKGLPAPIVCDYLSREASKEVYAGGTTFHIGKIEMVANSGTYIDAPFHRFEEGKDIAELDLSSVAGIPAIKIIIPKNVREIGTRFFEDVDILGKAIIIETGWCQHWNTDKYFEGHPYLTADAAAFLKQSGALLIGIDSLNIDNTATGERPVHTILLGADILIVEHLCNLNEITDDNFEFFAVPVKVKGMGTFPVRAFAKT